MFPVLLDFLLFRLDMTQSTGYVLVELGKTQNDDIKNDQL